MTRTMPVYVVDDDANMRHALRRSITAAGFEAHLYAGGRDFLGGWDGRPGCLVLDLSMPDMHGMELLHTVDRRGLDLVVLVITGYGTVEAAIRAMHGGALDFLEKPVDNILLLEKIEAAVVTGQQRFARRALARDYRQRLAALTTREGEVLELLVLGMTSPEIGRELAISRKTVDIHRSRIMQKLDAASVTDLVRDWYSLGAGALHARS